MGRERRPQIRCHRERIASFDPVAGQEPDELAVLEQAHGGRRRRNLAEVGAHTRRGLEILAGEDRREPVGPRRLLNRQPGTRPGATGGAAAATLVRVVLQCYYRDDRVLRSLGLELRAPFPKGYTLEQGDWALLDPVKARAGNLR